MATNSATQQSKDKKMQYKKVKFDVNEIAPDAPAGEWRVSIPRGKCKVQPTREDHWPMLIVPIRLEATEDDENEKSLGTELSVFITFFGDEKARAARLSKIRLRQLCEAADVDLDDIPKELDDPENDLEPLIRALEGKKFTAWTKLDTRKDTGEVVTEVVFVNPKQQLKAVDAEDEEESNDDDAPESGDGRQAARRPKPKPKGKGGARR